MEHVNDMVPPFYPCRSAGAGPVEVRQANPSRVVAIIPDNINGLPGHEGWAWGMRVARGLCYDTAGVQRAHRAGRFGFGAGLLLGVATMLALGAGLGLRLPSQCVNVGPYITVPNGNG